MHRLCLHPSLHKRWRYKGRIRPFRRSSGGSPGPPGRTNPSPWPFTSLRIRAADVAPAPARHGESAPMAHGPSPDRVNSPHGPCHTATSSRIWDEAVAEPHNAFEMRTQTFEVGARPKTDYMMHTRPIQATSQLRCADVQQGRARWLTSAAQLHYERGISFARSKNTLVCRRCRSISDGLNSLPSSAFVLEYVRHNRSLHIALRFGLQLVKWRRMSSGVTVELLNHCEASSAM